MKLRLIKGCGQVGIEFTGINDGLTRATNIFLEKLTINIVKRSTTFYKAMKARGFVGDHIFSYSEKQMHSVICPSIADITPSFVIEHPLGRNYPGEERTSGLLDYWISYKKYSYLMELKHALFGYKKAGRNRQRIFSEFNTAVEQLKSVRKDQLKDLIGNNKAMVKIALEVIPFYRSSKHQLNRDTSESLDLEKLFDELTEDPALTAELKFRALWILNRELIEPLRWKNKFLIFPAVAFVGNIMKA